MNSKDSSLDVSRIRRSVREIDGQVRRIEAEHRLFQRYGFGSDVHDIQLTALRAEKRDLLVELEHVRVSIGLGPSRRRDFRSWLFVPAALGAVVIQALHPRRQRRVIRPAYAE